MNNDLDVLESCNGGVTMHDGLAAEITEIVRWKVRETTDEFIFQMILPFCEEQTELSISKRVLIDALTEYFAKHGMEEKPNAE